IMSRGMYEKPYTPFSGRVGPEPRKLSRGLPGLKGIAPVRLSIFWRLALGSLVGIVLVAGINLFALFQLRQLSELSTELVSYHYPSIEQAKLLISVLYNQLRNERKYLVARDQVFLDDFERGVQEFHQGLNKLLRQEAAPEAKTLLRTTADRYEQYVTQFRAARGKEGSSKITTEDSYEHDRNVLITQITDTLNAYIDLHQAKVSAGVTDARDRAAGAEAMTQRLLIVAIGLVLVLAALGSYSILRPLRRIQDYIRQIGQGHFGPSGPISAPSDLRELVDTVNWMARQLRQLDEMKAEFLANVSHELRTPLASIREGTHLLLDEIPGPLNAAQREALQIMAVSSQRLILLISTLLDLSKIEAGMMEYRMVPTDFRGVLRNSLRKMQLLAESRHVKMVTEGEDTSLMLMGDGVRLEQVLDNVLSNAIKFSPDGAVVTVRIEPSPSESQLRVSVIDTGSGIAPEDLPHLFERFYQGRRQQSGSTAVGSGLGLALVKKVVEAHSGRVWIESEMGKGTKVTFTLPLRKPEGAR
ncbi:MAG: ATP-binding protein, partial [Nitrospirales bacterium]